MGNLSDRKWSMHFLIKRFSYNVSEKVEKGNHNKILILGAYTSSNYSSSNNELPHSLELGIGRGVP